MSVARLLLCYVLLEEYSTNLSAAITSRNSRSAGSNSGRSTGNVPTSTSELVQRNLTLQNNNVPSFAKPIGNVTAACRGEAVLSCTIRGLGNYKVAWLRAEDQTVLSLGERIVTQSNRFSVSVENVRAKNLDFSVAGADDNNGGGDDDEERVDDNDSSSDDASSMTDELTWRLHIRSLKEADRGCYMCQVNTKRMLNQLGCVDVLVAPDILVEGTSEGEVFATEGENVTLTCNASGRPQPQVHWRSEKNNFILTRGFHDQLVPVYNASGARLEFNRVDRRQTGAYLCIAQNEVPPAVSKRVYLRVNFAPRARVENQLLSSPLNTDVSLVCEIEASPKTINLWTRRPNLIIMSGGRYEIHEHANPEDPWKTSVELRIRDLRRVDLGEYDCSATSSLGTASSGLRLYEMERPTTTTTTTTPRRVTHASGRKIHRDRHTSSFFTTPRYQRNRSGTSSTFGQRTTPLITRKKYLSVATSTSTMPPPRVTLNKDKNALKHNEILNSPNTAEGAVPRGIRPDFIAAYFIVTLRLLLS